MDARDRVVRGRRGHRPCRLCARRMPAAKRPDFLARRRRWPCVLHDPRSAPCIGHGRQRRPAKKSRPAGSTGRQVQRCGLEGTTRVGRTFSTRATRGASRGARPGPLGNIPLGGNVRSPARTRWVGRVGLRGGRTRTPTGTAARLHGRGAERGRCVSADRCASRNPSPAASRCPWSRRSVPGLCRRGTRGCLRPR